MAVLITRHGLPHRVPAEVWKSACTCGFSRRSLLARWMTATAPLSPAGSPRSAWRSRYQQATVSMKMRSTSPRSLPSNANGKRRANGRVTEMGSLRRLRHEHGEDPSHPGAYGIFAADND